MTQAGTPQISYQAAWNPEINEVTVIQSYHAGVSGPHGEYPATSPDEALLKLAAAGYAPAGEWTVSSNGVHWTDLVR